MGRAVSAAEANRRFSTVLREVRAGHSYVITSHGRPVARMVPVRAGQEATSAARATLFRRLKAAHVKKVGTWTRDELYEEPR